MLDTEDERQHINLPFQTGRKWKNNTKFFVLKKFDAKKGALTVLAALAARNCTFKTFISKMKTKLFFPFLLLFRTTRKNNWWRWCGCLSQPADVNVITLNSNQVSNFVCCLLFLNLMFLLLYNVVNFIYFFFSLLLLRFFRWFTRRCVHIQG